MLADAQVPASTEPALDPLRSALHRMWGSVAPSWAEHASYVDDRGADVADAMLDLVGVAAGDRVLELGCGPGGVGLAAAPRVGSTGEVVLSDVAPEMVAVARARVEHLGLDNVTVRDLDVEMIDEPDASYDVVLCREALMLVPEPARALGEMRRVLRPGGRVAVAVWGPRGQNPWLGRLFDAITAATGMPVPPPGMPGPFSLDDADRLHSLVVGSGLEDSTTIEVVTPVRVASFDEWWAVVPSLAGPIADVLASLPVEVVAEIRADAERRLVEHLGPDGGSIPGLSLVAAGRTRGSRSSTATGRAAQVASSADASV